MSTVASALRAARRHPPGRWLVAGVLSLLGMGCLPVGSTPLTPLPSVVRPLGRAPDQRPVDTLMVATLVPRATAMARIPGERRVVAPRDERGPDLVRAMVRLDMARRVIPSPLSRASPPELLRAAQGARAGLLLTSQVVDVRLRRGVNARFAGLLVCALTVGMTLVGIPACMAIRAHTLVAEVELELDLWDVGQRRRVWQQRLRRQGTLSVSSYTARRAVPRALARGVNEAYVAALARIATALTTHAPAKAQNSGVKR